MTETFEFYHEKGDETLAPLLVLHGTGGDEHDLVPLAKRIAPTREILSPRGKVSEGGMNRFFCRFGDGRFDEADVRLRAGELSDFVQQFSQVHGWKKPPVAVGFSNGANIAAAMLYLHPEALGGAVLLRAMVPLQDIAPKPLGNKPVLLISGDSDPYMSAPKAIALAKLLETAGATVKHDMLRTGHGLTQSDIDLSQAWLDAQG